MKWCRSILYLGVVFMFVFGGACSAAGATYLDVSLGKKEQTKVKVYEASDTYYKYINGKFGYTIEIPRNYTHFMVAGNWAGITVTLFDKAALTAYGSRNYAGMPLNDTYFLKKTKLKDKVKYSFLGNDYYVISWSENNMIYYEKEFRSANVINVFEFVYPVALKNEMEDIVIHVENTFISKL